MRLENTAETGLQDSYPTGGTAWTVRVDNDDPARAHGFTVYAICMPSVTTG